MATATSSQTITIGTRVHTNLYGRGYGTVYAIDGEQSPESVRIHGGVIHTGGGAKFDIVFDGGAMAQQLPECILRGVQWRIVDEAPETPEQIAQRLALAATVKAEAEAKKSEAKNAFAVEVTRLKTAPEFAHLTQGDRESCGKLVAANIRKTLKKEWPKVKFSVRKADYGTVNVSWEDGPSEDAVKPFLSRHKAGSFNSMEDYFEYQATPFNQVFGEARYIFAHRSISLAMIETAIEQLFAGLLAGIDRAEKPQAEAYRRGELRHRYPNGWGQSYEQLIREALDALCD